MKKHPILDLLRIMAKLRDPKGGCPWDLRQDHMSIRYCAVEEAYELLDAIEASDDHEMAEELGDFLLQVVFHSQLAKERGAFDFAAVCRRIRDKLISRHPHVFGTKKVKTAEGVVAQWEQLKNAEKKGTKHERPSALDGIPRRLPALLYAEKLVKKARKAELVTNTAQKRNVSKSHLARALFDLAERAQRQGWSAEELLRGEIKRREVQWRARERRMPKTR